MSEDGPKRVTLVSLLLGAVLAVGGVVLLGVGIPGVLGALADSSLAKTKGTVDSVTSFKRKLLVTATGPGRATHENVIVVHYSYEVDGKRYSGDRYAFDENDEAIVDDAEAQARIEALRDGETATVLYAPGDPATAVLARREMAPAVVVSVLGAVAAILGIGLVIYWRLAKKRYARLKAIHEGTLEWSPP